MMFIAHFNQTTTSTTSISPLLNSLNGRFQIAKKSSFLIIAFFLLLLNSFSPNTMKGAENNSYFSGGYIVIVQGLTESEVVLEFGSQPTISQAEPNVLIRVYSPEGQLVHEQNSSTNFINFSSFGLTAGQYTLEVQVGGNTQTLTSYFQN